MNKGIYHHHLQKAKLRQARLEKIKELLTLNHIQNPEQLVSLLVELGVETDLGTVLRDLQGLQIRMTSEGVYSLPNNEDVHRKRQQLQESLRNYALDVDDSVNFLVIKISPGHEDNIAKSIEGSLEDRIMGTINGRGVVFVVAKNDNVGNEALAEIHKYA